MRVLFLLPILTCAAFLAFANDADACTVGDICTDGGLMLVEKTVGRRGLTKRLSVVLTDRRDPTKVKY